MAADDDEVTLVRFVRPDHFPLVALNNDKSAPSDRENKRKKTPLKVPQQSPIVLGLWQMAVGAAAVKFRHFAKQIQILSPLCQCLVADSSYAMEQEQVGLACRHSRPGLQTTLSLEHKVRCVGIFRKKKLDICSHNSLPSVSNVSRGLFTFERATPSDFTGNFSGRNNH